MPVWTPAIMNEVLRGFLQFLKANAVIVPRLYHDGLIYAI
jgi:hypothetical protein